MYLLLCVSYNLSNSQNSNADRRACSRKLAHFFHHPFAPCISHLRCCVRRRWEVFVARQIRRTLTSSHRRAEKERWLWGHRRAKTKVDQIDSAAYVLIKRANVQDKVDGPGILDEMKAHTQPKLCPNENRKETQTCMTAVAADRIRSYSASVSPNLSSLTFAANDSIFACSSADRVRRRSRRDCCTRERDSTWDLARERQITFDTDGEETRCWRI